MKSIAIFLLVVRSACFCTTAFVLSTLSPPRLTTIRLRAELSIDPQVFSAGYSPKLNLLEALLEATNAALKQLPPGGSRIDLCIVSVSSLYDGQASPTIVVPTILNTASVYGTGIQNLIGCTAGGIISSNPATSNGIVVPIEAESIPGVSVTLCLLPDVQLKTFHVLGDDVPDDLGRIAPDTWKRAIGLSGIPTTPKTVNESTVTNKPVVLLFPSNSFDELDDLLSGFHYCFPAATIVGGIASTVSSLSRARLFRYDATDCTQTLTEGCVGLVMQGDIEAKAMIAQGTKPVGGIYRIVKGGDSTIQAICLDEVATQQINDYDNTNDQEQDNNENKDEGDAKQQAAAAYAKASIPKPILAEANFLLRTLSDDDQASMRKAILVGLERGGPRTPNDLARLAAGQGHRFVVKQVASAGMKDGSVTLPRAQVTIGSRMRFFVRESDFAKKEVQALWTGYKKQVLEGTLTGTPAFIPSACIIMSTMDRGNKFFGGKAGFESNAAATFVPTVPCISGFFTNGVVGPLDDTGSNDNQIHGSAAAFVLFGSVSRRPIYNPAKAAAIATEEAAEALRLADDEDVPVTLTPMPATGKAPRADNGELIIKRRELHAGRALTVSAVAWSVAEMTATPTSTLEGFMWDKETEVDRFRERVPLANLLSQCKLAILDPNMPKPRDFTGPIQYAAREGFVIIPDCKRMEPVSGSLRKRYDIGKLVKNYVNSGVSALSVNCDQVLFGGQLDDVTKAREAAASAAAEMSSEEGMVAPPILASDLILYPYQLYKLHLAGADAVNLLGGALAGKDLSYLTKIAASLKLQVLVTVTSVVQTEAVCTLPKGSIHGLIVSNRELEDFSFDTSGQQVLDLLKSDAVAKFRSIHGETIPVLAEGRVGMIERDGDSLPYINELKDAGATGAIVGGGLVVLDTLEETSRRLIVLSKGCY
jgi:indole-3-glycerol phosphate synthase